MTPEHAAATREALESAPHAWLERDLPLLRKDGSSFPGRLRVAMTYDEAGAVSGSIVLVSDTSSPRASSVELSSPTDHRPIAALGRLAISGIESDELLQHALRAVTRCLAIELAAVVTTDSEAGSVLFDAGFGWEPSVEGELIPRDDPQAALLMDADRAMIEDLGEFALPPDALLRRHGVRALAGAGLRIPTRGPGALLIFSRRVRRFGRSELDFLQAVANVLAAAADRAHAAELEERLERFSRMDALGRLTGGIAHDFNNLLAVILSYAAFAREEAGAAGSSAPDESLQTIEAAAKRAAELTHQLLVFSRQELVETRPTPVAATVSAAAETLRGILGDNVELEIRELEEELVVEAGPDQLEQILFSTAFNASEAMPDGGSFRITLEPARGEDGPGWVRIELTDTGRGMSREIVEKAFDPFFTTKPVGQGPGLGLSTVYGLVASMGGSIGLDSEPDRGTSVDILLPVSAGDHQQAARSVAAPGRDRVLLVEDDEMVRRLAVRVLEEGAFDVSAAADQQEAIELAGGGTTFDVLVTDIVMPPSSGAEIVASIQPRQPDAAVVYMSGYSGDMLPKGLAPGGEHVFVAKPFTPETLLAGIREALASRAGPQP